MMRVASDLNDAAIAGIGPTRDGSEPRYRVERLVGKGGMGSVYLAHDRQLDRPVALKCMLASRDAAARDGAIREAKILANVDHGNVLKVYDAIDHDGTVFIVSEWVEGLALGDLEGRAGPGVTAAIGVQLLRALEAVHAQGIFHRDIKPSNLMVTRSGVVKLIDFGVAYHPAASTGETLAGSLQYTDPTLLAGGRAEPRSDLYSTGLVLLELLTGEPVLPSLAPLAMHRMIQSSLRSRVRQLVDGRYPPLAGLAADLILQCFGDGRGGGGLSASAARGQIEAILAKLGITSPEEHLKAAISRGEFDDRELVPRLAVDVRRQLAAKELRAKDKASWVAYAEMERLLGRNAAEAVAISSRFWRGTRAHLVWPAVLSAVALGGFALMPEPVQRSTEVIQTSEPSGGGMETTRMAPRKPWAQIEPNTARDLDAPPAPVVPRSVATSRTTTAVGRPVVTSPHAPRQQVAVRIRADAWADVYIDGKSHGRLPRSTAFSLSPGRHRLVLKSPYVETLTTDLAVPDEPSFAATFKLERKKASVTVSTGSKGTLTVAGQTLPVQGSATLKLPYGTHRYTFDRGALGKKRGTLTVEPGGSGRVRLD